MKTTTNPPAPQNAMEPHFTLKEIATAWGISVRMARRIFRDQPGVSDVCSRRVLSTRPYTILRIPASVAARVHTQRDTGFVLGAKRRK
jgi:DNA-binding LacI/PurR family transcriptional regulator